MVWLQITLISLRWCTYLQNEGMPFVFSYLWKMLIPTLPFLIYPWVSLLISTSPLFHYSWITMLLINNSRLLFCSEWFILLIITWPLFYFPLDLGPCLMKKVTLGLCFKSYQLMAQKNHILSYIMRFFTSRINFRIVLEHHCYSKISWKHWYNRD